MLSHSVMSNSLMPHGLQLTSSSFPRQEYWSGLLFPSPGNLPHPNLLCFLHWQVEEFY